MFAILSSHYLNKVIVIDDFQFSGRQLIDTGKEEDFKEMVKDDVREQGVDTDIDDDLAGPIIGMYKKNKEYEKEREALEEKKNKK